MNIRHDRSGILGGIIERELFGESRPDSINDGERIPEIKFRSYEQSLRRLKELQPFDPIRPAPEFAYMVRRLIQKWLNMQSEEALRFYTAVESPLDKFHGVDGWFEIIKEGQNIRITIDITKNEGAKDDGYKADITFLVPDSGLDRTVDKEQFIKYSASLAKQVCELFEERSVKE